MKKPITVREYAQLEVGEDDAELKSLDRAFITLADFESLCKLEYSNADQNQSFLQIGHQKIKMQSFVGIIETPNAVIEILPKIARQEKPEQSREILQNMLACYLDLPEREINETDLERYHRPLHEWLMKLFLDKLTVLLKKGIRLDYERVEEQQPFLRGQLDIPARMRQPFGRQHIFPIRHDIYSLNRAENRLLKAAVEEICKLTKDPENWRLSHEYRLLMQDIVRSHDHKQDFKQWRDGRLLVQYQDIRTICEIILTRFTPVTTQGAHRGISLLFPMEKLFEKYVAVQLRKQLEFGVTLREQVKGGHLCQHKSKNIFGLEPDLLIKGHGKKLILDTKWKRLEYKEKSINKADVHQMFAYSCKFECDVVLVYLRCETFEANLVFQFFNDRTLYAVPFDLIDETKIFKSAKQLKEIYLSGIDKKTAR